MPLRHILIGLTLSAGLASLAGCSAPGEPELIATADQAIKGGYSDPNDLPVVDIVWVDGQSFSECSGSLLAPNMVLTAHHCVANLNNSNGAVDCLSTNFQAPAAPSAFGVSTKQFLSQNQADYHGVSEVLVPDNTVKKVCGYDQAILILNVNIDPSEAVPMVPRVDVDVTAGEQYSAIGFGGTVDDGTGAGQRRRLDNLHVNCVGKPCSQIYGNQIDTKTELVGDHGICEGDSGGPAVDMQNRVFGVTSRGSTGCTSPVYGDVFGWGDWIKQTAVHAAQVGGYDAPPWATGYPTDPAYSLPVGDPCGDPPACQSGLCLADSEGDYCTRPCSEAAACPDGYTCETIQNQQICQRDLTQVHSGGNQSGGCTVSADDSTKHVPWSVGAGALIAALAVARRRRRG